jgi:hypothetical protein
MRSGRRLARSLARARGLDGEHVLEVGDQLAVRAVAAVEVLGRGAIDDGGQGAGDLGAAQLHVWQLLAHVLHRHRDLVLAVEGDVAGEHLEEHDAQRVEVALRIDVLAQRLLGRDVVGRAEHAPVGGEALLGQRARDPEVGDLGRALLVDEDVLGLDVAVDDAVVVGGAQGAGDLDRVGHRLADRQAPVAPDAVLERLALHVLEDDVRRSIVLARVDDADDVGVVELRDRARLAPEALELVGVRRDLAVHELDRDLALEHRVERAVDRRHPAGADLGVEPVAPVEQGADLRAHRSIVRMWAPFM